MRIFSFIYIRVLHHTTLF